jgi:hypothetical protein
VVAVAKAIGKHAGTLPHIVRLSLALRVAGLLLGAVVASLLQGHGDGADGGDGGGEPDDGGDGEDDELHLESGIVGSWVGKGYTCLSKVEAGDRGGYSGEEKGQRIGYLYCEWTNAQRFPWEQWSCLHSFTGKCSAALEWAEQTHSLVEKPFLSHWCVNGQILLRAHSITVRDRCGSRWVQLL